MKKPSKNDRPEAKPNASPTIGTEIELLVNQIDALAETLPLASLAIQRARATSAKEFSKFLEEECSLIEDSDGKQSYRFTDSQVPRFQRFRRRVQRPNMAEILVPRGLLVAMVSQFDAYIGALIRHMFRLRPEMLDASEKALTFSQLVEFKSIEAARSYVIEREIETVLRQNHVDQFVWFETKLGIPLRKDLPSWVTFVEATERRNLFVHTNGIVSRQYLDVCKKQSCPIPDSAKLGVSLPLSREYFTSAYECILEIGVKLGQVLWRKLEPSDVMNADINLSNVTYGLLSEGRYKLARILLDFSTETLKKHSSDDARRRFIVNRAQAYKWSGDTEKCKAILSAEDWSASNLRFQLAYAVLTDDFKTATEFVRQLGHSDSEMDQHTYRDWPLFREFRKYPEFISIFETIFNEPLNKFVLEEQPPGSSPVN